MGARSAKPLTCSGCPECEYCQTYEPSDCKLLWNKEYVNRVGASGDAKRNHWEYEYKQAKAFVHSLVSAIARLHGRQGVQWL
jgi:hypothetical protein